MTDAEIAVILRRLDEQDARADREATAIGRTLGRIEGKVDKTNGRVTKLETDKAVNEAVLRDHDKGREWRKNAVIALVTAAITGGIGSIVAVVAGGHI